MIAIIGGVAGCLLCVGMAVALLFARRSRKGGGGKGGPLSTELTAVGATGAAVGGSSRSRSRSGSKSRPHVAATVSTSGDLDSLYSPSLTPDPSSTYSSIAVARDRPAAPLPDTGGEYSALELTSELSPAPISNAYTPAPVQRKGPAPTRPPGPAPLTYADTGRNSTNYQPIGVSSPAPPATSVASYGAATAPGSSVSTYGSALATPGVTCPTCQREFLTPADLRFHTEKRGH